MRKKYWLHIIPISRYATPEPTAQFLLVGNEYPHPGGAAPSHGYLSWEQLKNALRNIGKIEESVLQEATKDVQQGMAFTIPDVELDEAQVWALGLNLLS